MSAHIDSLRHFFSGTYGFRLQSWLRATENTTGDFIHSARPQIEPPVVVAGFQSPVKPKTLPDPLNPLPAQAINSGYYPYGQIGVITYALDISVKGHLLISIGGNTSGQKHDFAGNYVLLGVEGTYTYTRDDGESFTYAFILTDDDNEIEFMDVSSAPGNANPGFSFTAVGVQKKIAD